LCDRHNHTGVIQNIHVTRVREISILLRPGSGERSKWTDNSIDRAAGTRKFGRRVPVLQVVFLSFAFGDVGFHDVSRAVLGAVGTDELWCGLFAGESEVVSGVGAAVEGVYLVCNIGEMGMRGSWLPLDDGVAFGSQGVNDHLQGAGDGWVYCTAAVVAEDCE
jgi:hypothetical protein